MSKHITVEMHSGDRELRPIAVSRQIAEILRERVLNGGMAPGEPLPSRRKLAAEFRVAVGTVQYAVAQLVTEGLLVSRSTSRTEVAGAKIPHPKKEDPLTEMPLRHSKPVAQRVVGIACDLKPVDHPGANIWRHSLVSSIEQALTARNCSTRFLNQYRPGKEWLNAAEAAAMLTADKADAIVLVLPDGPRSIPALARWVHSEQGRSAPVIVVGDRSFPSPIQSVFYDNVSLGYQAAEHLIDSGCKRLCFFSPYSDHWITDRLNGVREASILLDRGSEALRVVMETTELGMTNPPAEMLEAARRLARTAMTSHWEEGDGPVGVIAANDHYAIGWIQAATELGISMGMDYAIMGVDDALEAREFQLTTFRPPLEQMGLEAAKRALAIGKDGAYPVSVALHAQLLVRQSCRLKGDHARTDEMGSGDRR